MSVFFMVQYIILHRKEHLSYSLYLSFLWIYYLLAIPEAFFPVDLKDPSVVYLFNLFKRPVQFTISVCYTFFIIYYLNLRINSVFLYRLFRTMNIIYVSAALLCLLGNILNVNYNNTYFIFSIALFPVQIYLIIALFRHQVAYSRYIIWGSFITVVASSITLVYYIYLFSRPQIPYYANALSYLPVMAGILADMYLFSIALQKKIADTEKFLVSAAVNRQQAIAKERERIIADLHDDVGGGLSSIRMLSDLMQKPQFIDQPGRIQATAEKISTTAKEIAQRMHTIIWSLNADNDSLENFYEYVRQYGVSFFGESTIAFECFKNFNHGSRIQLSGVQRKNLFLITKEAFHNILKHAKATKVTVSVLLHGRIMELVITDNGDGMHNKQPTEGSGNGLKNMRKRMDEIGGSLSVSENSGLTLTAILPLRN
jgi:signal transduction histidine kinase